MPAKNALRDVNPLALTLCKQGANRQRIFLRKTSATEAEHMLTLPAGRMPILKTGDDWTTFYCVVAAPGAEEDPGLVGDQDSVDVWADAAEIRKAAHRLLKNAAFVNTEHDGPAAEGCAIVESAVALADLTVGDTVIAEGSWYVGIEPSAELRKSIEDGTIEAISLEGSGVRESLEKAASFGEVIGAKQLRDALWSATSTLEDVIYTALRDDDEDDPKGVIRRSLDEFVNYLAPMLDSVTGESRAALAKQLGTLRPTDERRSDEEDQMGLAEDVAALKKSHEEGLESVKDHLKKSDETSTALIGLVGKLTERVEALAGAKADDKGKDEPADIKKVVKDLGSLADKMDEFDSGLESIAKSVRALGEGGSSQDNDTDTIRKQNNTDPLAGLLA